MKKWRAVTALVMAPMVLYSLRTKQSDVHADPPVPTVVLLRPGAPDAVTNEALVRVRGELKAAGFEVATLPLNSSDDAKHDLETAGAELHPIAAFAIFVMPPEGGKSVAEIWVSDRIRKKTVVQNALLHESDRGRSSAILAVRAVELLKASLADFWNPSAPARTAATSAPTASAVLPAGESENALRAPFASGLGAGLGAGVVGSFGSMGATWAPEVMASYGWPGGFSLRASFMGLGPAVTLSAPQQGSARVDQQLAMLEAVKTWWPQAALVPFVCAGAGAQHVHVTGTGASPSYQGHTQDNWSPLTLLGGGIGIPVVSTLSVLVQARGLAAWLPSAVTIAGAEVGRAGAPSLLVDAGLFGVLP
jgi:hypothetical protein